VQPPKLYKHYTIWFWATPLRGFPLETVKLSLLIYDLTLLSVTWQIKYYCFVLLKQNLTFFVETRSVDWSPTAWDRHTCCSKDDGDKLLLLRCS